VKLWLLALSALFTCGLCAQPKPSVAGDYAGVMGGALHVKLGVHVLQRLVGEAPVSLGL
jgi:hypothetical protein